MTATVPRMRVPPATTLAGMAPGVEMMTTGRLELNPRVESSSKMKFRARIGLGHRPVWKTRAFTGVLAVMAIGPVYNDPEVEFVGSEPLVVYRTTEPGGAVMVRLRELLV